MPPEPNSSPSGAPAPSTPAAPVRFGRYRLDAAQARLTDDDGRPLGLAGRPFELLCALVAQAGQLLDKDSLLDAVWGHRHVSESALKGAINTVRLALGDDARAPVYIETVPRRGYRFLAPVTLLAPPAAGPLAGPAAVPTAWPRPVDDEPAAPGNMPARIERPIGREAELALLQQLMDRHRLVTLTGLAGVGKTCLALAMAARVAEPAGGRWLLRLDELAEPGLLLPTVAQCLHLGRAAGEAPAALARALADQQLLLVLDNAEHLVAAVAGLCAAVLHAAPDVQLLVTSQQPLQLAAEAALPVAPLALAPVPTDDAAAVLEVPRPAAATPSPAAQLLALRIRQHWPHWVDTPAALATLEPLCRSLDGVPLALELAAARVPLLGLDGVQARLAQGAGAAATLLSRPTRDGSVRHHNLASALDWTFGLLQHDERTALLQLAVFAGSFALEDAEGVLAANAPPGTGTLASPGSTGAAAADALARVEALRARALLVAEPVRGGMRLRLYDSVRRHALQALADSGGEHPARLRHLAWMGHRLQGLWRTDADEAHEHWLPHLRADVDSLREALRFGLRPAAVPPTDSGPGAARVAQAAVVAAVRLAADSCRLWHRLGLFAEGWQWLQQADTACAALSADTDAGPGGDAAAARVDLHALRARIDLALAYFCGGAQQGDPREAWLRWQRADAWAQAQPDPFWRFVSAVTEADLTLRLQPGRPGLLEPVVARLAAALPADAPTLRRRALLRVQGTACRLHRDFEGLRRLMVDYEALCHAHGARESALVGTFLRLQALALLARWDEAREGAHQLVQALRRFGLVRESVFHMATAAAVLLRLGPRPEDRSPLVQALRLLRDAGLVWWLADALPWAAWHDGRPGDALRLHAWAEGLVRVRAESRGPLFAAMQRDLAHALARHGAPAELPDEAPPLDDDLALHLALGIELAQLVVA